MEHYTRFIRKIHDEDIKDGTIILSNSPPFISPNTFAGLKSLSHITIPNNVTTIEEGAFYECLGLETICLPNKLEKIGNACFFKCESLSNIVLPDNITSIPTAVFQECSSLKEVVLPQKLCFIGLNAFYDCTSLEKICLPSKLIKIHKQAFTNCSSLKEIIFPENLEVIESLAFSLCSALSSITFPENLVTLESLAFKRCSSLKKITFLSKNLTLLKDSTFLNCTSLEKVILPNSLKSIEKKVFYNCVSLKEINIPKNVFFIHPKAFDFTPLCYFSRINNNFVYSASPKGKESLKILPKYSSLIPSIMQYYEKRNKIMKIALELESPVLLTELHDSFSNTDFDNFIDNVNLIFYKQINKNLKDAYLFNKLYYCLGGFSFIYSDKNTVSTTNYAQKVGVFLKKLLDTGELTFEMIDKIAVHFEQYSFKPAFTDFFLNKENFSLFLKEELLQPGFIGECFNRFEEVMNCHKSNKGEQRKLAPTISKFKDYFLKDKFNNVTEENKSIAEVIGRYFSNQETFDDAINIDKERREHIISNNILKEPLKEENIFKLADDYDTIINNTASVTLSSLINLANKKFTFEWLQKDSPINFVLGKLCDCCSHIEGYGYSIMKASILHPSMQTLVIRNEYGKIIAKSTLYINKDEQYGVFNNVEVSADIPTNDMKEIYVKFKYGALAFIEKYNKENEKKPLLQVNVGTGSNDLLDCLQTYDSFSNEILKPICLEKYGNNDFPYRGDSLKEQIMLWKNNINKTKK